MSLPADRTAIAQQVGALVDLPGVRERAEAAREACTRLRFHEALRRRVPEASAESRVRGAQASAALDGANLPLTAVREHISGARTWPDDADPGLRVVRGAVGVSAESERVVALVLTAPLQVLARLHVAAASSLLAGDRLGRPRTSTDGCDEFIDLGPPPPASVVSLRLANLADLITSLSSGPSRPPAVVVSSIVHAEIVSIRPFAAGNGLVARAMERVLVQALGLDPTGVAVPEAGHVAGGGPAYLGALTAYGQGTAAGVGLWLRQGADAVIAGAGEGVRICDAVRAGRLG